MNEKQLRCKYLKILSKVTFLVKSKTHKLV